MSIFKLLFPRYGFPKELAKGLNWPFRYFQRSTFSGQSVFRFTMILCLYENLLVNLKTFEIIVLLSSNISHCYKIFFYFFLFFFLFKTLYTLLFCVILKWSKRPILRHRRNCSCRNHSRRTSAARWGQHGPKLIVYLYLQKFYIAKIYMAGLQRQAQPIRKGHSVLHPQVCPRVAFSLGSDTNFQTGP